MKFKVGSLNLITSEVTIIYDNIFTVGVRAGNLLISKVHRMHEAGAGDLTMKENCQLLEI